MANPKETIILYDGKQIASFLAGQTATLTTKGDEVEHNIVVVAGSGGGAAKPILQEKTATENGDVLPDEGYDGLSKVTVDVAGEVLPVYDGEVIIEGEVVEGGGVTTITVNLHTITVEEAIITEDGTNTISIGG